MSINLDYRAGNALTSVTAAANLVMETIVEVLKSDEKLCRKQNMGKLIR